MYEKSISNRLEGYASVGCSETRPVEVSSVAGSIEYTLAELESSFGTLAGRLDPVLSKVVGNPVPDGASACYSCDLAVRLSNSAERIRGLRVAVDGLLGRLEV